MNNRWKEFLNHEIRKTKLKQERNQERETESESVKKEEKIKENEVREKMEGENYIFSRKLQRKISFKVHIRFALISC